MEKRGTAISLPLTAFQQETQGRTGSFRFLASAFSNPRMSLKIGHTSTLRLAGVPRVFQYLPFMKRQASRNARRVLACFFGAGLVDRERRGGLLSMAARKMRLMRVW